MARSTEVRWHWICVEDADLAFLLGFDPDRDRSASRADLVDVIRDFQDIIEDGLETA
jgi:hypothetical protein